MRSTAGGRSTDMIHCIGLRMVQLSDNGRQRRLQETRRGAIGPGQEHMGPFCVCRRVDNAGSFRVGEDRKPRADVGKEREKMGDGPGVNKWLSTLLVA